MAQRFPVKPNYTPNEVGHLIGVHHNTVKNWIRRGGIHAFQTVGGHFRIPRREVARLVSDRGLSVPEELEGPTGAIYVVEREPLTGELLSKRMGKDYQVVNFSDGFDALMQMGRLAPDLLVFDTEIPGIDASVLGRKFLEGNGGRRTRVLAVGDRKEPALGDQSCFDEYHCRLESGEVLLEKVRRLLAVEGEEKESRLDLPPKS